MDSKASWYTVSWGFYLTLFSYMSHFYLPMSLFKSPRFFSLVFSLFIASCSEPAALKSSQQLQQEIKQKTELNELSAEELAFEPEQTNKAQAVTEFTLLEWDALIPQSDLEALMTPPDYITNIEDGSLEDNLERQIADAFDPANDPYQQALVSTKVMADLDGQWIKIPGFIVPIESEENEKVTEFFIVPYFGACLHLPPPPPNQIIYASYPQGIELTSLYDAFWISGKLNTEVMTNEVAQAAYTMRAVKVEPYNK